jgi:uncharacterized membrane protein YadS
MHSRLIKFGPGVLLCAGLTTVAALLEAIEVRLLHAPYLEALVLAIILGVAARSFWTRARFGKMESGSAAKPCWKSRWSSWVGQLASLQL